MQKVLVLNGPNLARLGSREPDIYGSTNYEGLVAAVSGLGADLGLSVEVRQTDSESELIGWLHEAAEAQTIGGATLAGLRISRSHDDNPPGSASAADAPGEGK